MQLLAHARAPAANLVVDNLNVLLPVLEEVQVRSQTVQLLGQPLVLTLIVVVAGTFFKFVLNLAVLLALILEVQGLLVLVLDAQSREFRMLLFFLIAALFELGLEGRNLRKE